MTRRITDQQWAVANSVLDAGFSVAEASKYSGISKSTLWQRKPQGHPAIYASVPAYYRAKEMLEEEGASYNETEKTTGISSRMLRKHFPNAGWRKSGPEGGAMGAMIRQLDRIEALYA